MESQARRVLRALFTKEANALEDLLNPEAEPSRSEVASKLKSLIGRYDRLVTANDEIEVTLLGTPDLQDDALSAEWEKCTEYEVRYLYVRDLAEQYLEKTRMVSPHSVASSNSDMNAQNHDVSAYIQHKFMPEITRKFDGNVGNWIGFWTQFEKVHTSTKWSDDDKFDILLKGLKPNSAAANLVSRFPPSAENYNKAVELLKSRFGRDEHLIEYYVRKLLSLVLTRSDSRPISELYDELEVQLQALDSLKVTKEKYAAMLFPLVESAVPESTFRVWERCRVMKDTSMKEPADCLTELLSFLRTEVEGEERLKLRNVNFSSHSQSNASKTPPTKTKEDSKIPTAASLVSTDDVRGREECIFCEKSHPSQECAVATDMSLEKRNEIVKKRGACFKCLKKSGHLSSKCKLVLKCVICKGRHYPLMCGKTNAHSDTENKKDETPVTSPSLLSGGKIHSCRLTFLQTLVAKLVVNGQESLVRVLLDSGSQKSYIVRSCIKKLKLKRQSRVLIQQEVFGGSRTAVSSHGVYTVKLKSLDDTYEGDFEVLDQERICSFVPKLQDAALYNKLKARGIMLSDFSETIDSEIQVLLGADAWAKVLSSEHIEVESGLLAINTKLGWTIIGSTKDSNTIASSLLVTLTCHVHLANFWDLELLGIRDSAVQVSQEEKDRQVQEFFEETVKIEDGRYTVSLPWIEGHAPLEENLEAAQRRLYTVTKRLRVDNMYDDYDSIFQQWIEKGIIEVVPDEEISQYGHYLPHRAVIKEGSTTRVRPVFDASNRDRNGNSLNKSLEKGPNLIEQIPMILINFRKNKIGVSSDIEKAFLMISLAQRDRDYLRFLWWKDGELLVLRHCRVVFGVAPSPYLLGAVLEHLLRNVDPSFQETADILKKSFYVDNCLTSLATEEGLDTFVAESQEILASVGFNLRGWVSNSNPNLGNLEKPENVLGLNWFCGSDEIGLNINLLLDVPEPLTRRVLMSIAQRVYDPIGFSVPVSLVPKVLLQKSWSDKARWDDPLPQDICKDFMRWVEEIPFLKDCRINRQIVTNETSTMHIFCDASKMASAACIFIRTELESKVFVSLVMAKSRVAPLEGVTIPRLELIAALIGTRLYRLISPAFQIGSENIFFWSDSSVVVCWIKNAGPWTVFVANRVNEIRSHSDPAQWRHIPGCMNPADLISRGCTPRQLLEDKWWEGPTWLHYARNDWPSSDEQPAQNEVDREKRKTVVSAPATAVSPSFLLNLAGRISSYYVIVKVIMSVIDAVCIICPEFATHSGIESSTILKKGFSSEKFSNAELALLRSIQREYFDENVKKSALKGFTVFHDDKDLIRVKTRILDDEHSEEFSCPVILPGRHPLVMRLIEYQHIINNHAGILTLLTLLRERFWLICGRQAVGMVVRRCVICRKNQAQPLQVPMPPLPTDRTRPSSTFQITGVDLAGPIFLKDKGKAWIVIFTCAVYRAVHLELIQSLSTEAFIQALRRFIARRGRPKTIYSDNGTNFVGLDNLFQQIDWNLMEKECGVLRIRWKFNPPTASWWGGFWERLIRVLKDLLKKNLGKASLAFEDMTTMLCECESLMNNRPLTYVADDPSELAALKPSMFLQSLSGNDVKDLDQIESTCLEKKWAYLQRVREGLKKRFTKEYLGILRNARPKRTDQLEVGDIVLVGSDNKRRLEWPLAKVLELKPGRDGVTRLVKLLTKNGEILRPFQRIYPLEIHGAPMDSHPSESAFNNRDINEEDDPSDDEDSASQNLDPEDTSRDKTRSGRVVKPRQILDL